RAALVGREVVRLVEKDRIDGLEGYELGDVGRVAPRFLQRLELLRRKDDVLILGELVALHHVLALYGHFLLDAQVLLLETRSAALVQECGRDGSARLCRRIQLDRNGPEPEGDCQRSNRSCSHATSRVPFPGFASPSGRRATGRPCARGALGRS